jgi:hypothetical protein
MNHKLLDITIFIIRDVVFPTSIKNPDPFKGQGAYGGMIRKARVKEKPGSDLDILEMRRGF